MKTLLGVLTLAVLLSAKSFAQDAEGCKDHSMFTRMPGYSISACSESFNQADVYVGNDQTNTLEGKVTSLTYENPEGSAPKKPSWFQIVRNYENAVVKIGGKKLYSNAQAATYKVVSGGKETWVALELHSADGDGATVYTFACKVVEIEEMQQEITANEMLDELNKSGFIALYINFETGKADIKPESQKIVDQIFEMLKANASLAVGIEGHTDTVGAAASNKTLSENRATSVMNALIARGIAKSRLSAKGWGQEKPVADNRTEDGRAKNRRVEVVKK